MALSPVLPVLLATLVAGEPAAAPVSAAQDPWTVDFRYAPPWWQTAICLPDDWQKTLVGKEGTLLYDYPGKYSGFATRIAPGYAGETKWVRQELVSPRVPIVRTIKQHGSVEIVEEAFAVAPPIPPREGQKPELVIERVGSQTGQSGWAAPPATADPAFRNVAIGWKEPVRYRFKAGPGERFTVVFGLCEGFHPTAGQRILDLQIEGKIRRTVDLVAEKGRNVPEVFPFTAQDEDGDGWIDVAVSASEKSRDKNTILNVLWVFRGTEAPAAEALVSGQGAKPPLARVDGGPDEGANRPPRHDVVLIRLRNPTAKEARLTPTLTIDTDAPMGYEPDTRRVLAGAATKLFWSQSVERVDKTEKRLALQFYEVSIAPRGEKALAIGIARGRQAEPFALDVVQAEAYRRQAEQYWQKLELPYGHLEVPDPGVQALIDSSIRNIYQAREIKKDLPAFQVGPTCYRGLWVVDGSFLLEAITYLGRAGETRNGVKYLMSFQRPDGGFLLMDGHWKETGIALWAITRHARLTGDKTWLREVWPQCERGVAFIRKMRGMPPADAPNARLIPDGFSDGGLADRVPEYTNIYWTMAGLRAAIEGARWLGNQSEADDWQKEYEDFLATFRRAAARDTHADAKGNRYVPIRMAKGEGIPPQKAQWAFLHAVFPGKVFAADDPLVQGNMAMLKAVEEQGLVLDTGWLKDGIWNYFASFYAHAWLWLGDGDKAARTLYAFGNHASPLLVWREEQKPVGKGEQVVGDMPHNWASAEFIRLARHALVLERGNELHLFEAFPAKWARAGAITRVNQIETEFGPVSLEFRVSDDGAAGTLRLTPPRRTPPERIVWHLDQWSGRKGTLLLPGKEVVEEKISLAGGKNR